MKRKEIVFILGAILLFLISMCPVVLAKYEVIETRIIAQLEIDRTAPIGKLTYSKEEPTKENVEVTIEVNEPIKPLEGWRKVEDNLWKKEYTENTKETVIIQDLSGNQTEIPIIISNIDRVAPIIKVKSIHNSNEEYPNFANQEAVIQILLQVEDENRIQDFLTEEEIKIWIQDKKIETKQIEIKQAESTQEVEIILKNIREEGKLKIEIDKASIIDELENESEAYLWDSNILLDNTNPVVAVEQKVIEQGKVEVIIKMDEEVRKLEGWNREENQYSKIFENNISYEIPVQDLAGNITKAKIEIKNATSIILRYASHNSEVGWTFGYGNYDIAGLKAIKQNRQLRTEALAFSIEGNVEPDFLQVRAYVHTYWGEGSEAICQETKQKYVYGFNPSETTWKSMATEEKLAHLADKRDYFILGGTGVNWRGLADAQGNNPLPDVIAVQHLYGISGISFKLKDTSLYSIIYQIYIEEIGWLAPCKNEEFACYQKDKPISGIRVALVPNSELEYVWDEWEQDTGEKIE